MSRSLIATTATAAVLCVALVVALASAAAAVASGSEQTYPDWMSRLPDRVKNRKFKDIIVLGSHDSGARAPLNFAATPPCQATPIFNVFRALALDPLTADIAIPIVGNLTVTQPLTISQQLELGIRSFDLRITYSNITNSLWISHSYVTQPLHLVLANFSEFISRHPEEVLTVDASYDWEHRTATAPRAEEILRVVDKALGRWLNPLCDHVSRLTLGEIQKSKQVVLFSFGEDFKKKDWPQVCAAGVPVHTFWPNGQSSKKSIKIIDKFINVTHFSADPNRLYLIFMTVTPNGASILKTIERSIFSKNHTFVGLKQWSEQIRPKAEAVMENFVRSGRKGISILSVDWPTSHYVERVIEWNLRE